jgi:hypothetical protein
MRRFPVGLLHALTIFIQTGPEKIGQRGLRVKVYISVGVFAYFRILNKVLLKQEMIIWRI